MTIIEIEVGAGLTLPTTRFGNIKPECHIRATLEPGENVAEANARLRQLVIVGIKEHIDALAAIKAPENV